VLSSFIAEEGVSRYGLDEDPEKREKEFLVYEAGDVEKNSLQKLRKDIFKYDKANWVGLSDRYFIFTVLTDADNVVQNFDNLFNLKFRTIHNDFNIYIGPKDVDMLNTLDPSLRNAVNFGVLSILSIPMLELMKFLYGIIPNYGVAILLLTLIVRLLMYPLQHKSMKSMKRMQELQPYIKKLQEKYKDDKEKLNKEMMQFMKTHKMNPMGGCLPMLLQLPVFIALYKVLNNAVELYRSPFVFWIKDLSLKDPYYVLPVLMGGMMFLQQKLMPNPTMDSAQSKMMMFMPIMFTFLMISLPSGLTLYIMFSTLLGVIQQYFTNKKPSKEISVNGN
jgi:YidC/Oxa1 family membrane protein insertase